jgi:hypothetical protein
MSHPPPTESLNGHQAAKPGEMVEQTERGPNAGVEPILCQHCGRTASNGISCEGYCVADSGY